jgi:predicted metal-dependent hydrolase
VPIHRDTFYQINKKYPNDKRKKVRANIFLQDWMEGQFIHYEMDGQWHNSTHWKAGDGFIWDSQHLHLSGNAGFKNKYTLQVSGFLK